MPAKTPVGRWVTVGEYLRGEVIALLEATAARWMPKVVASPHDERLRRVGEAYLAAADALRDLARRLSPPPRDR